MNKFLINIFSVYFTLSEQGFENMVKNQSSDNVLEWISRIINSHNSDIEEHFSNNGMCEKSILNRFAKSNFFDIENQHKVAGKKHICFNGDFNYFIEISKDNDKIIIKQYVLETRDCLGLVEYRFVCDETKEIKIEKIKFQAA